MPSSRRAANHSRRYRGAPRAPHPSPATPALEFVDSFRAGHQEQEEDQELQRLAADERKAEEGRAAPLLPGPPLPLQPPLAQQQPPVADPRQYHGPQLPPQSPPPASAPVMEPLLRGQTGSPFSYIRRPPPHYRNRSRSSSGSSISRRSFEALRRRVNILSERLNRLERWREDVLMVRLYRLERWKGEREAEQRSRARIPSLSPEHRRRRQEDKARGRATDVERVVETDVVTDAERNRNRWDWEGGGLGRR